MTSASTKHEPSYVIALLEGRGVAREVGMAALDKNTGKVMLVQVSDYNLDAVQLFTNTSSSRIAKHT